MYIYIYKYLYMYLYVKGVIQLYRQFDEPQVTFQDEISAPRLKEFIKVERFALFNQISIANFQEYIERGIPIVWVALNGSDPQQLNAVSDTIQSIAKQWKGKISFVWIDNNKYGQRVEHLVTEDENIKYLFEGDLTNKNELQEWIAKYMNGHVERFFKSQDPPEINDDTVLVLVGKTFENVVGKDKHVFVNFYAPWCGHSKKLEPEYDKVGMAFSNSQHIIIAKMDLMQNDCSQKIQSFPTLIFYPKGSKNGIQYNGGHIATEMIDWLHIQTPENIKQDL
ncbi:hypothetical protein RFI_22397 [Reticulomyxa filosa]|uniref:Thioredoxin domain-containing protein n=1 Tax=Reticulomyxa filosa TaxID=46433 RepID=X6MMU7_RETFI|nr:hypothetical protein RFI_22397 [Reticulomyxa filosa]|eukprot:ETO14971.1 hypothetical protein RFI_22397 [Reticulomyxa filosa]